MDKILELLMRQPIIAFFLLIWVVGAVTNAKKARDKARERQQAQQKPKPVKREAPVSSPVTSADQGAVARDLGTGERPKLEARRSAPAQKTVAVAKKAPKSPEEVAREMRRILGLDPDPPKAEPPKPAPAAPQPAPVVRKEPQRIEPASVVLRDSPARAKAHVDSHVGEGMRDRHMAASKVGRTPRKRSKRGAVGSLGGRTAQVSRRPVDQRRRFPLNDLRKAIVLNEILSPPVGLRQPDERLF